MALLAGGALKLAVLASIGGVAIASPFALSEKFTSKYPLTTQKLNEFKSSKGFDACYTFLQNKNKISLLFVCLKKMEKAVDKKTHESSHYLYNGGSWEEAISLRKNPYSDNSLLVKTKSGWFWNKERGINNTEEKKSDLDVFGSNKECKFKKVQVEGAALKSRIFKCSVDNTHIQWSLKNFE